MVEDQRQEQQSALNFSEEHSRDFSPDQSCPHRIVCTYNPISLAQTNFYMPLEWPRGAAVGYTGRDQGWNFGQAQSLPT